MIRYKTLACMILGGMLASVSAISESLALDIEKAHETAIQNCVNWNGETQEFCACVQDRVRTDLSSDSYMAMMQYAEAYQENRRADLAAMQVDVSLSKALESVDGVMTAAQKACKS